MKLIGTLTSPFVRKVRIALAEKQLDFEFIVDPFGTPASRIAEFNPLGKLPCLVSDEGDSIYDSSVIVDYLDELSPAVRLVPASGRERIAVKTWEALADGLTDAAVLIRMETHWPGRTEQQRSSAWIDYQMQKIERALATMSRALGDRPHFQGQTLGLADIAAVCALDYLDLRLPQLDWRTAHPALQQLHERLSLRPSCADTRPPQA